MSFIASISPNICYITGIIYKVFAFLYEEPKFWAEIYVNEERAKIDGNQLEY